MRTMTTRRLVRMSLAAIFWAIALVAVPWAAPTTVAVFGGDALSFLGCLFLICLANIALDATILEIIFGHEG